MTGGTDLVNVFREDDVEDGGARTPTAARAWKRSPNRRTATSRCRRYLNNATTHTMEPLHNLTIKKFHEGLLNKKFSALEVTQAYFRSIKETRPRDRRIFEPRGRIRRARRGERLTSPSRRVRMSATLAGVPLAIKDYILIKGLPATAASKILENYVASYDAGVIKKLKAAAARSSSERQTWTNSRWDRPRKIPRSRSRTIRTTSRACPAARPAVRRRPSRRTLPLRALGSDTGGSIRQPASVLRRRRPETDVRRGLALRRHRDDLEPGPGRPDRKDRGGRRDTFQSDRRDSDPMDATSADRTISATTLPNPTT